MPIFGFFKKYSMEQVVKPPTLDEIKQRAKILLIDDDPEAIPYQFLQKESYSIETWATVESVERLERGTYDIIILDIQGVAQHIDPERDGFGVLKILKENNPNQMIIACSGQDYDPETSDFFNLADDKLSKPVKPEHLKRKVDRLLRLRFDARFRWEETREHLISQGVSEGVLSKLENHLAECIATGEPLEIKSKFEKALAKHALNFTMKAGDAILKVATGK